MNKLVINRNCCGFFSDFLTTLAGIMYCNDNNEKFYVEWYNNRYTNIDNENIYNVFFKQPYVLEDIKNVFTNVTPYGYYFPDAVNTIHSNLDVFKNLKNASDTLFKLDITNTPIFNNLNKDYFNGFKTLGVQKRGTDHYGHGEILSDSFILSCINNELKHNSYDKVFLITDDNNSFNFFQKELGDMLLYTNSTRTSEKIGVHNLHFNDKNKLAKDVITDSVLLSLTDFKLITRSNVSTFSLLYNLNENFKYIDNHIEYV